MYKIQNLLVAYKLKNMLKHIYYIFNNNNNWHKRICIYKKNITFILFHIGMESKTFSISQKKEEKTTYFAFYPPQKLWIIFPEIHKLIFKSQYFSVPDEPFKTPLNPRNIITKICTIAILWYFSYFLSNNFFL